MAVLDEAYKKAIEIINDNVGSLDAKAAFLLEKETITGTEFMDILEGRYIEAK